MAKRTPIVRGDRLTYQHQEHERVLTVDTPDWYAWLESASAFAYTSDEGRFTARRERAGNQRGGWYWKAYRSRRGKLASFYLGKSETLSVARLKAVARELAGAEATITPDSDRGSHVPLAPSTPQETRGESLVPLLATKLHRPPPRSHLVRRPHLTARLTQGVEGPLTLVSAPAGFGKTTLLAQWLADSSTPSAWLSLDEGENDPARFLMYLIAAVQTVSASVGAGILGMLQSPQPPPVASLLSALINDLSTVQEPFVLVLDDYHSIDSQVVDQALSFLLEHLPSQLHLVISTREDPRLPLARLRVGDQLREVRVAELRFTPAEATEYLNQVMGLHLSKEDVAALERRTEGWIAGLHLAALSLQGQPDTADFIASFTGGHRFVLDYLVEEVLQRLPERVQMFLLRTSILKRLCGPLCDAVLRGAIGSGQATLEYLDHANLFLVALDNERRWYRYHHLFAELLQLRLRQSIAAANGEEMASLAESHSRASIWFEEQGLELEAFQHAAAANDVERAERLMGGQGIPLHMRGAAMAILEWLRSLPTVVMDARPSLWVRYASLLLVNGQTTGVEEKLQAAETALQGAEPTDQIQDLIGRIAAARATLALTRYQVEPMIAQSRRALEYLPPANLSLRANAYWTLGFAYFLEGDLAGARQAYTEGISLGQTADALFTTLLSTIGLGQVQERENQLHQAAQTYRRVLRLAGDQPFQAICEAQLGLARVLYEWNELDTASQHGQAGLHLARQYESVVDRFIICEVFLARLRLAEGDTDGAAALLAEAGQSALQNNFVYRIPEVAAVQVLTLLQQGSVEAAALLAEAHDLPLSRARVHLAQGDPARALAVLEPRRRQVEAKGWADERLRVLVLQTVALQAQGEKTLAVQLLLEALALAEPGGYIRLFVDEGDPMAHLLAVAQSEGRMPDYIGRLLAVWKAERQTGKDPSHLAAARPPIEPLSRREGEVLQLLALGLSNHEIAGRLVLALDTVKGHNRSIFSKLQVQRRTGAVARARELGLL
jgi:LuxR family transcriptional regulator, maltose regulon positive regulatory protein